MEESADDCRHVKLGCSCCCVVLLAFVGVYAATIYAKLSPVYQDVDCGDEVITVGSVSVSGLALEVDLGITLNCMNPNPYEIKIVKPQQGKIYEATGMTEIGTISARRGVLQEGSGQVTLDGTVRLSGASAFSLIGRLVSGPVHVFMDVAFKVGIEQSILVTSLHFMPSFEQKCGVSLSISDSQAGGVTCGRSFEDLVISDIGVSLRPGAESMGVDQEVIDDATQSKNLYLGGIMGICFCVCAVLIVCQVLFLVRLWRSSLKPSKVEHGGLCAKKVGAANA